MTIDLRKTCCRGAPNSLPAFCALLMNLQLLQIAEVFEASLTGQVTVKERDVAKPHVVVPLILMLKGLVTIVESARERAKV